MPDAADNNGITHARTRARAHAHVSKNERHSQICMQKLGTCCPCGVIGFRV